MKRLAGVDAAFLYAETPSWHMHVSMLLKADAAAAGDAFSFERLRDLTVERLPQAPQFRWRVVDVPFGIDRPGWVEAEHFDPDDHIRRISLPSPGGDAELRELVGRLVAYKIDRSRPLWEMWVIDGLASGEVAVLTKVHHSIIDGISGVGLAEVLLDLTEEPRPAPSEVTGSLHGERVPSRAMLVAEGLVNGAVRVPVRAARFMAQTTRQAVSVVGFARRSPAAPFQAPRSPFNGEITPDRAVAFGQVSLARVRSLRRRADVKVNDIVLALCAGSLRTYLSENRALPANSLLAQCPVSLRVEADPGEVGNKVGSMYATLATDVVDPVERLHVIAASTRTAKELQHALSVHRQVGITETVTPGWIGLAARTYTSMGLSRMPPPVNVVISNVAGPPIPLFLCGAPITGMYPLGPLLLGIGLNVTVFSHGDVMDIGVQCCPTMVPDPQRIADGVGRALDELDAALT